MPRLSRRSFLGAAAATFAAPALLRSAAPNEVVRHASFGAGGMARADLGQIASHKAVQLVCVAEVDATRAASLRREFPDVKVYADWREMLDREAAHLDSVNVSTPDHMHAAMAMSAMQLGLHVYCQKPLTHNIYESRRLAEVARASRRVTQMGIQVHSSVEYRSAVALIREGAIGPVHTVHSWSSKKWGDPSPRPERSDPVPPELNWDLWLGVAADRPYIGGGYYHPGNWRKRLDFGTGTFGDMGCHILDPVCKALALTAPTTVKSVGNAPNAYNWANDVVVEFHFPATNFSAPQGVKLTWYDGDRRPPEEATRVLGQRPLPDQGSLFLGTKGALLLPHVAPPILLPEEQFADYPRPSLEPINHWHQFVDAVRGEDTTSAPFDYAGPLTEWVLMGGVATFFPHTELAWNAENLQFTGHAAATSKVRRTYRAGWEVEGLS
jgi:predicted dehydrogenase